MEIACIILLFLLGIMSQMKVWKIIKERRDEKAAAQLAEEHRRDQAEEDIGKRLEEGNERERAMWESAYGEQDHSKQKQIDSGVGTDASGSVRKSSLSAVGTREIRNSISESMEMSNLDAPNGPSRKASQDGSQENSRMMVQVASDDRIPSESHEHSKHENRLSEISTGTSIPDPSASMTRIAPSADLLATAAIHDNAIDRSRYHSGPKITPLPFKVPDSNAEDARDDVSSIATCAASERYTDRGSKRMSRGSLLKSLSRRSQRHSRNPSDSNEALIIPHVEEDCASSVAATIDGVSADRDSHNDGASADGRMPAHSDDELEDSGVRPLSLDPTIVGEGIANSSLIADLMREGDEETQYLPGKGKENPMNRVTVAGIERNPEESTLEPFHEGSFAGVKKPGKLPKSLELLGKGQDDSQNKDSTSNSEIGSNQSNHTKLSGNLPESSSKVVMAYRTNEWAKHLESAEKPELDDLDTERVPSGVTSMETKETAAPVRVDDLKQTPLTAEPAPIQTDRPQQPALNRSSSSKDSLSRQASSQQVANRRRHPSGTNVERSSSQTSLQTIQNKRESSSSTLNRLPSSQLSPTNTRGFRSSSTPLLTSPLVESPIEEGIESSFPIRFTPSPMHLMSQRDTMVRNKMSSTSLNRTSSTPSLNPIASASNESFPPQNLPTLDEDISLATRKTLLQQNPSRSSLALQQHPSRSSLAIQQANPSPAPLPTPNRSSSNPRESTLSAWRSSLRAGLPTQQAAQQEIEARRTEMMHEKRRASNSQQWAQLEQGKGESILDRGMRRGDLLDKHREAMRRMQGEANRNL